MQRTPRVRACRPALLPASLALALLATAATLRQGFVAPALRQEEPRRPRVARSAEGDDDAVAIEKKVQEEGEAAAQYAVGTTLLNKKDPTEEEQKWAAHWLGKAASAGDARAQLELGLMTLRGLGGMPKDAQAAAAWVSSAANQGNADAQHQMGLMLLSGIGVDANPEWAKYWFEQVAEKSCPCSKDAAFRLAVMHQVGQGMEQDEQKALRWYSRAAEQGHTEALSAVQAIYRKGDQPSTPGNTPGLPKLIRQKFWGGDGF